MLTHAQIKIKIKIKTWFELSASLSNKFMHVLYRIIKLFVCYSNKLLKLARYSLACESEGPSPRSQQLKQTEKSIHQFSSSFVLIWSTWLWVASFVGGRSCVADAVTLVGYSSNSEFVRVQAMATSPTLW